MCSVSRHHGPEFADECAEKKEQLDEAMADYADAISQTCWEQMDADAKQKLSEAACSARQPSDITDNEAGKTCGSLVGSPYDLPSADPNCRTCLGCCNHYGTAEFTPEGPGTGRPYGPRCTSRYESYLHPDPAAVK
jgi:hypothetical protein